MVSVDYKKYIPSSPARFLPLWVICGVFLLLPVKGETSGNTLHIFMAHKAIDQVTAPALKKLLENYHHNWVAGAALPDGGYLYGFSYSEIAHWPDFHVAYFDYVRGECKNDLTSERCGPLIAHMLGMIGHGFEDESYDVLLDDRSRNYKDKAIQNDSLLVARDTLIDKYVLMDNAYLMELMPIGVSPLDDVFKVFENMGKTSVKFEHLVLGQQSLMAGAVSERMITNIFSDVQDRALYSWLRKNYETAPGGVKYTSAALSNLWDFYWDRLHNINRPAKPTIFPADGGALSVDRADPWSQFHFLSDRPLKNDSFNNQFYVTDLTTGYRVPFRIRHRNGYMVDFIPQKQLVPGHKYQITIVASGVKDYWGGAIFQKDFQWTVTAKPKLN